MKEILGKKLGMTRVFGKDGASIPVTVLEAGPCPIVEQKTTDKHGYEAYRVGFEPLVERKVNKPSAGVFSKAGVAPTRYLRELRIDGESLEVGQEVTVEMFRPGDRVDVSGVTRGLGFAGTIKRHNFAMANKTHGQSDRLRAPGSIGQASYPGRVFKGQKMAGRMGRDKMTVLNLEVVKIIKEENLMLVKGAVPGFKGAVVKIRMTNRG